MQNLRFTYIGMCLLSVLVILFLRHEPQKIKDKDLQFILNQRPIRKAATRPISQRRDYRCELAFYLVSNVSFLAITKLLESYLGVYFGPCCSGVP